ncbi:MAG: anti-sigma factor family protein [Anaerolineae bacterium]
MDKHVTQWLGAYYDGELSGRRLQQVEEHLATCEQCQEELDALSAISSWLHSEQPFTGELPPERFVAQVELLLPREQIEPHWTSRLISRGWQMMPIILAAGWVLLQTLVVVYLFVNRLGLVELPLLLSPVDCVSHALSTPTAVQAVWCSVALAVRWIWALAAGLLYVSLLAAWWITTNRQRREAPGLVGSE